MFKIYNYFNDYYVNSGVIYDYRTLNEVMKDFDIMIFLNKISNVTLKEKLKNLNLKKFGELIYFDNDIFSNYGFTNKEIIKINELVYNTINKMDSKTLNIDDSTKKKVDAYDEIVMENDFEKIKYESITDLNLSVRAQNCLLNNNINTIYKLMNLSSIDLIQMKNLGKKTLKEIESIQQMLKHDSSYYLDFDEIEDVPNDSLARYLSVRAVNCLKTLNIKTITDLGNLNYDELLSVKNLGAKTLSEIMDFKNSIDKDMAITDDIINYFKDKKISLDLLGLSSPDKKYLEKNNIINIYELLCFSKNDCYDNVKRKYNINNSIEKFILENYKTDKIIQYDALNLLNSNMFEGIHIEQFNEKLNYPQSAIEEALNSLIENGKVRLKRNKYYIYLSSIFEYLKDFKNQDAYAFLQKINGMTLENIGLMLGITRERVRQKISSFIKKNIKNKAFKEDYLKYIFTNYLFTKEQFLKITKEDEKIYNYLNTRYSKGDTPLNDILNDNLVSARIKRNYNEYVNKDYLVAGKKKFVKNKKGLLEYIIYINRDKTFTSAQLHDEFNKICDEYNIDKIDNERSIESICSRSNTILYSTKQSIRYYNISAVLDVIVKTLNLNRFRNISISTKILYDEFEELMNQLDIRSIHELHTLIRKAADVNEFDHLTLGKSPILIFDNFSIQMYIENLVLEIGEISKKDLVKLICESTGYDPLTVPNYFTGIYKYLYNDMFMTVENNALPTEIINNIKEMLGEDIYRKKDFEEIFYKGLAQKDSKYLNWKTIQEVGYVSRKTYYLKQGVTYGEALRKMISSCDILSSETFKNYDFTVTYYDTLNEMKRTFDIIEYENGKYITIKALESIGYTKDELMAFINEVKDFCNDNKIDGLFTYKKLERLGFNTKLPQYKGISFYENLIKNSGLYFITYIMGKYIFENKKTASKALTQADIVTLSYDGAKGAKTEKIRHYFKENFDIELDNVFFYKMKEIKYYNDMLDMYFDTYEDFLDY